jgi:hypothetical protein
MGKQFAIVVGVVVVRLLVWLLLASFLYEKQTIMLLLQEDKRYLERERHGERNRVLGMAFV